jgi:NADP-dependent 3-hydroxy acid dehydrogenase YdfG
MATATKMVLITGASSGIGRSSVARMVRSGWSVFATVRKEQDGALLHSDFGARVIPIIMDVYYRCGATSQCPS